MKKKASRTWLYVVLVGIVLLAVFHGNLLSLGNVGYPHVAPSSTSLVYSNHNWQVWKVVMPEKVKSIPYPNPVPFTFSSSNLQGGGCRSYGPDRDTCHFISRVSQADMGEFWKYPDGAVVGGDYNTECLTNHGTRTFPGKVFFLASFNGINFSRGEGPYPTYETFSNYQFQTHNTGVLVNSTPAVGIHSNTFYVAVYITGRDCGCQYCAGAAGWGTINGVARVPKTFPFSEIYYVPEDIQIPVEPIFINSSMSPYCPVPSGYALATQSFAGPTNLTIHDMRYPVNYFCESLPIIETSSKTGLTSQLTGPYQELLDNQTVSIPAGDTWTVFYGTEATADMNMVCPDGSMYNASTNKCDVYPAVVHICSEGVLDPDTGLCTIQPDTIVHCQYGEYDSSLDKCVYTPQQNDTTCVQGTYNQVTGRCEISADTVSLCDKGYYDTSLEKCVYHPPLQADCPEGTLYNVDRDACEWTPDLRSICDNLGTYNPDHHQCETPPQIGKNCEYTCSVYDSTNPDETTITKHEECVPDKYWKDKQGVEQERHETQTKMDCDDFPTCDVGVYSDEYGVCTFPSNQDIPFCDNGVWDQSLKRCTSNPSLSTQVSSIFPPTIQPTVYSIVDMVHGTNGYIIALFGLGAIFLWGKELGKIFTLVRRRLVK